MMRVFSFALFLLLTTVTFSQTTKPVKTSPPKLVTPKPAPKILKDLCDSASYTAGIHIVNKYRGQQVFNFNSTVTARAINDLQTKKPQLISNSDADKAVLAYQELLRTDPKPVFKSVPGKVLSNLRDSASYAAGIYLVNFFRDFDITNFNSAVVSKAMNDLQQNKQPLLRDSLANIAVMRYQSRLQEIKNRPAIEAGRKFLDENKKRPSVKVTASGLQYEIITEGKGRVPVKGDKITCHYTGSFIDGIEFNNSHKMGGPISFNVTEVIKGWTEALLMMPVGSKWKLYVPYTLAYGPGQYQTIPGGSTLVFEIDLLGIVDK